jgi:hypothetical protein
MRRRSMSNGHGSSDSGSGPASVTFRSADMQLLREFQQHWWWFM